MPNDQRHKKRKRRSLLCRCLNKFVDQSKMREKKNEKYEKRLILLRDELVLLVFTLLPSVYYLFCCTVQPWLLLLYIKSFLQHPPIICSNNFHFALIFLSRFHPFLPLNHLINEVLNVRLFVYKNSYSSLIFLQTHHKHRDVYLTLGICFLIVYLNKFSQFQNNEKTPRKKQNHLPSAIENGCTPISVNQRLDASFSASNSIIIFSKCTNPMQSHSHISLRISKFSQYNLYSVEVDVFMSLYNTIYKWKWKWKHHL